ncbi:MAG: dependent epimerase/dehydratase family [Bryobacterales bacterium]|nr:dependent epimerase/dehydratase family [Bryobacterales bacterium]
MSHRVLITGGSGFIGRNLVELLADRYEIFAPARQELDLVDEVAVREYLAHHRFDSVVHTATGRSNRKTTAPDLFKNNCRMFFNFARNQDLYGRMLHFGSAAEFDRRAYQPRMPETYLDSSVPADDYGFAKYVAAKYTETAAKIYNLRLFGVFGKYEAWEVRFISNACCRALSGMPITLRQNVFFDYLYIDDLARLTAWFIENQPAHHTYNVCRGETHDLLSLARTVARVAGAISGSKPEIHVAREGLAMEYSGDNTRMLAEIGSYKFRNMEDAIRDLYTWYENHRAVFDPALLNFDT